nr:S8 family serine peptidase [Streptomyces sp. S1D4-11]QIZ01111.1 S8 family serine peptidase [Streptomyces sp. S1D4-11]
MGCLRWRQGRQHEPGGKYRERRHRPNEPRPRRTEQEQRRLFVVAASNTGELGPQTVGSPGVADAALTAGAVDRNDRLAAFSSRGPRHGDRVVKPDVTAPGVGIVEARGGHQVTLRPARPRRERGNPGAGFWRSRSRQRVLM